MVEEGCFDRSQASHAMTLCDLGAKYADIVKTDEVLSYFDTLADGHVRSAERRPGVTAFRLERVVMKGFKEPTLEERREQAAKAKQAQLEAARAKSPANDPKFAERQAARAKASEARDARALERKAQRAAEAKTKRDCSSRGRGLQSEGA